jgi:hypothetical protein
VAVVELLAERDVQSLPWVAPLARPLSTTLKEPVTAC